MWSCEPEHKSIKSLEPERETLEEAIKLEKLERKAIRNYSTAKVGACWALLEDRNRGSLYKHAY